MKKLLALISVLAFLANPLVSLAFTKTPSLSPSVTLGPSKAPTDAINDQINELKERIASRVAQLKLVERRGIIGTVTEVSDTQVTINDIENNTRFADVDELTKFSSPKSDGAFGISDISRGQTVGILGLYNKQSRRVLARFVDVLNFPKSVMGMVASKDNENFALSVVAESGKQVQIDVENITRTNSYTKDTGLIKSGFSKITENERIYVVGFTDTKDKNKIIASRVIVFPDLPISPKIKTSEKPGVSPIESTIPSTGSGKKLTPIK